MPAEAERIFGRPGAQKWLRGLDPRLGDRRPLDVLRTGAVHEVIRALAEHKAGSAAPRRAGRPGAVGAPLTLDWPFVSPV